MSDLVLPDLGLPIMVLVLFILLFSSFFLISSLFLLSLVIWGEVSEVIVKLFSVKFLYFDNSSACVGQKDFAFSPFDLPLRGARS
jgi:hypothetical protein